MHKKVLVIIVTYNAMPWIQRCINSILASNIDHNIYVIDNGSVDGTQAFIRTHYDNIIFHQSDENLGFGKANNIAIKFALENGYDYVYLLNQDAWVLPGTINHLIYISNKYPEYGVLSPIQLEANEKHFDVNFKKNSCSFASCPDLLEDLFFNRLDDAYDAKDVMAAHWLITKECIKRVGGFSNAFPHYGEDINYIDRVYYHKLKVGIAPGCSAIHDRESRKNGTYKEIYLCYIQNLVMLSNISHTQKYKWLIVFTSLLKYVIHYKSLIPLKFLFKLLFEYSHIKDNMIKSKEECAFI